MTSIDIHYLLYVLAYFSSTGKGNVHVVTSLPMIQPFVWCVESSYVSMRHAAVMKIPSMNVFRLATILQFCRYSYYETPNHLYIDSFVFYSIQLIVAAVLVCSLSFRLPLH